ncbi:hypothetical protein CYMTET_55881 [Cymbomonas tetramitiformis]|uniref:Uncharacterized protein n=1 Tax=Cymbomonas tetramitiformis TaxID=36881 RepID=A0AAE0BDA8_9CHLO|nr:hypothetical protein CYMTET_55881 [Cymbomonas tetramitiformis]
MAAQSYGEILTAQSSDPRLAKCNWIYLDKGRRSSELQAEHFKDKIDFTVQDLVDQVIKPAIKPMRCKYIDLVPIKYVRLPHVLVTFTKSAGFSDMVHSLKQHFQYDVDSHAPDLVIWMDIFVEQDEIPVEENLECSLEETVRKTERTVLYLDRRGDTLTDLRCLYTAWKTHKVREGSLEMCRPDLDWSQIRDVILTVDVQKAQPVQRGDTEIIIPDLTRNSPFPELNKEVKDLLMKSVVKQAQKESSRSEEAVRDELRKMARVCKLKGDLDAAEGYWRESLTLTEASYGQMHTATAVEANNLASLLRSKGDFVGAKMYLEKTLFIYEGVHGRHHSNVATALSNLALLCWRTDNQEEAKTCLRRSISICERILGPEHLKTTNFKRTLQLVEAGKPCPV